MGATRVVLHQATGFSPFMIIYRREATLPKEVGSCLYQDPGTYDRVVEKHIQYLEMIH